MSTVVDAGDDARAAGRSRGNVYCGRRRWRRPGSWQQQGKMSTVADSKKQDQNGEISSDGYPLMVSNRLNASSAHTSRSS